MALEALDRLDDNIHVNWRHICRCILRHTSSSLALCMTSWKNLKKQTPGRELSTSKTVSSLGTDSRCLNVHLFKQLNTRINTIRISSNHTAQEGDRFCVPEIIFNFFLVCHLLKTKLKDLEKILLKLVRESLFIVKQGLYQHALKEHSERKKSLL